MERFISDLMNGNLSPRVIPIVLALLVITAGQYIWTAIVLLAAVALDPLARRGSNPA